MVFILKLPLKWRWVYYSSFRCNDIDYLLIKSEPMGEFNFEEQMYDFKVNWVFHTLIPFLPDGDVELMHKNDVLFYFCLTMI